MSYLQLPDELLHVELSATELRVLIQILKNTLSTGEKAGYCCWGYNNMALRCFVNKPTVIRALKNLEKMGFVDIIQSPGLNRANWIKATIDRGLSRCRLEIRGLVGNTFDVFVPQIENEGYKNDTAKGYKNDTEGYLNDTEGYLNDTPHIDLKFKNNNYKKYIGKEGYLNHTPTPAESSEEKKIEPADVATGRSMPDGEQVAESSAINEYVAPIQTDLEDFCFVEAFFGVFPNLRPWVKFAKVGGYFALQPIGSLGEKHLNEAKKRAAGWFELRGLKLAFVPANQILKGVILGGVA